MPSKTRSQVVLPNYDYNSFVSSTKKATRSASRNLVAEKTTQDSSHTGAAVDEEDDGIFPPAKRSPSGFANCSGDELQERAVKRAKRVLETGQTGESSNLESHAHGSPSEPLVSAPSSSKKPLSTGSIPSPRVRVSDVTLTPRARVIPMDGPIPHLDLTKEPASPLRSPTKSKGKEPLRIAPVSPVDAPGDVPAIVRHDADGDVRMNESSTSQDTTPDARPIPPRTLASASTKPSKPDGDYLDIQVAVKAYDGQAEPQVGPSAQEDRTPSHSRAPSTASRLPRPLIPKASESSLQLTLHQAFASTPRPNVVPPRGMKDRMKPKNPSAANTPTGSNQSTPTQSSTHPSSSKPTTVLKSMPIVATQRTQISALSTTTARSKTPVASAKRARSKTPARPAEDSRTKTPTAAPREKTSTPALGQALQKTPAVVRSSRTPGPSNPANRAKASGRYEDVSIPKTPKLASTSRTLTPARQRSKSTGPTRAKTPSRSKTPGRSPEERGRAMILGAAGMALKASTPGLPARATSPTATRPRSSQSLGSRDPPVRGRSHTPSARSSLPPSRESSLSPLTSDLSREPTPERGRVIHSATPQDSVATPRPPAKTAEQPSEPPVPAELPGPAAVAPTDSSDASIPAPTPESYEPSAPLSPGRKGRRKAPLARQASMPPMSRMPTRSSLRLREIKKNVEEVQQDRGNTIAKDVPPKAGPNTGSNTNAPPTTPGNNIPMRKRSQSISSFARPTESSAAKASPVKPRPPPTTSRFASRSMSKPPESTRSRPPNSGHRYGSSISSLSNLSMALEKLNAPAPSRPNTHLGFNRDQDRDADANDSSMDIDSEPPSIMTSNPPSTAPNSAYGGSKVPSYRRAATVGPSSISASSSASRAEVSQSADKQKQSTLMGPPPVPKGKVIPNGATANGTTLESSKPRINLNSGIVSGQPKGKFTFGNSTAKQRIFGVANLPGFPSRGTRVVHKASKQTSLPTVEGSPVKGGGDDVTMGEADEPVEEDETTMIVEPTQESNPFAPGPSGGSSTQAWTATSSKDAEPGSREQTSHRDESRRASMASRLLAESAAACPQTPPRKVPASEGKGKGRAVSSTFPSSSAQDPKTAPVTRGTGVGAHVARPQRSAAFRSQSVAPSPKETPGSSTSTPTSANGTPQSVRVLKGCVVFVDVKSEEGLDVSSLFTEMLQQMGAKILTRVGQSCTHVVYKNGLASTSNRWRALNDPKPMVVGIAWVVACAERREHVDEQKYMISLVNENVAGTNKRRKSFLPKNILESPERPSQSSQILPNAGEPSGDRSLEVTSSPASEDASANGSFDHLPPLERVKRRQSALFNPLP